MLVSYALGCVVGAYYIVRWRRGVDVRATGSGNAGARNVYRSGDRLAAALTLTWDVVKGALAVFLSWFIWRDLHAPAVAYFAVIVGHIFPAQLRFYGGRGVAPAIGASLILGFALPGLWFAPSPYFWGLVLSGLLLVAGVHDAAFDRWRLSLMNPSAKENPQ